MKRYLSQIPLPQAISLLTSTFPRPQRSETIPVDRASGRIVASAVYAPETVPRVRIATMDGIAVNSADTTSAQDQNPCILTDASPVSTGQEVPAPYDAVIPSEEVWFGEPEQYKIRRPSRVAQNIRHPGDEMKEGRLILAPGHRIIPSDIGALLTYGVRSIQVRTLIVGLIPTGDELVCGGDPLQADQVRESNTAVIMASLMQSGICPIRYEIVHDDPGKIMQAVRTAVLECDIVIVSAGSSAGTRDHTRETIEELGSILFHGVAMRPGKTLLCGMINGKPVLGLPGQPMAALTAWREVAMHLLKHWGFTRNENAVWTARIGEPIPSDGGVDEFIPISLVRICGEDIILPRPRGAAGQMQGIRSNGILHIPASKEGYREGASVSVRLNREYKPGRDILIAGISDELTDHLQVVFISEEHSLVFRPMSAIGAAALLCRGRCHGIILMQSSLGYDGDIIRLLKPGCPDQVSSATIGSTDGDQIMLVWRDTPLISEEISPLVRFLDSDQWKGAGSFPAGYTSEGAGAQKDLIPANSLREGVQTQTSKSTKA